MPYVLALLITTLLSACSPVEQAVAPSVDETQQEAAILKGQQVTYYVDDVRALRVKGYLSIPSGEGPHPAIILIHEWWGLNDQIREMADRFAEQGYVALAVDLYEGKSTHTPEQARELATLVRGNVEEAFDNLEGALEYLRSHPAVDSGRLASAGWCFGGGWSYEMAVRDLGVKASIIYYGQFNPEDDLRMMRSTIQGHFGEDDQSIPVDDVKAFRAVLNKASGEHQIFIYENAGHAFMNEGGDRYNEEGAKKAWERTMDFLHEQL